MDLAPSWHGEVAQWECGIVRWIGTTDLSCKNWHKLVDTAELAHENGMIKLAQELG